MVRKEAGILARQNGIQLHFAKQQFVRPNVRFGSKADIEGPASDVRFTPKSGHWNSVVECPLCAKSRHMQCSKRLLISDL
jgi:hypothetical protein